MMKQTIFFFLLCITSILSAQTDADCEQLAIEFRGLVESDESDQLFFEVSNGLNSKHLYHYPGLLLLDEDDNVVAKGTMRYYGLSLGFQTHLLELEADISFPFEGTLELHGGNYSTLFCSFPVEIEDADYVSVEEIQKEKIKLATTFSGNEILIDLGGNNINANELGYQITILDEFDEIIYETTLDISFASIPLDELGGEGMYTIDVWDDVNEKMLLSEVFEVE